MKRFRGRPAMCVIATTVMALVGPMIATGRTLSSSKPLSTYSGPVPLPDQGAYFGAFVPPDDHNGPDRRTALTNYEAMVGRQMAIERVYYLWNEVWPDDDDYWSAGMGRILYISWNSSPDDGSGCRNWADIAAGVYDAEIDAQATRIKAFPYNFFFSFHHEPTTAPPGHESCGTSAEYQAAWRHVHDRFVTDGVTNVTYSITYTAQNFANNNAEDFYPGDDIIDVVAADGYNWFGCQFHQGPWREMAEIFQPFYNFGVLHDKPLVVAEYGTGEDPDVTGKKGQWFTNGAQSLKSWPLLKGVTYFNVGNGGTSCDRYVDSSQSSLDGFKAMGADRYLNPPVPVTNVSVADFSFSPKNILVAQGSGIRWSFNGPSQHTVTETLMGGLFDSGPLPAGSTFSIYPVSAGTYEYQCTIHPAQMSGSFKIPVRANPLTGGVTTEFTIKWGTDYAPDGFAFDVQIKRPGSAGWEPWFTLEKTNSITFIPDAGVGTYYFRARYHDTTTDATSKYSSPRSIVVS